jgi:hypothetical protein
MVELIFKSEIKKEKMDALLHFLKVWDVDIEIKNMPQSKNNKDDFSLSAGIWKDYDMDATKLRKQAWKISE